MSYCVWCGYKFSGYYCEKCLEKNGKPTKEDDKMSESKVHVIPDENLGGVLREYVEVERKVTVEDFAKGRYVLVDGVYRAIEPTDVVVIDNQRDGKPSRFRLVDRKARVGEKVIVFGHSNENGNGVFTVYDVYVVNDAISYVGKDGKYYGASSKNYRVLEPVEPAQADSELVTAEEGDDKSVIDLLANLARRVTELERAQETLKRRQVIDNIHVLKRRQERLFEEINAIYRRIDALDERTQPLVKSKTPSVAVKTVEREFDRWSTKTKVDAYVLADGFRLEGTFEFDGVIKNEKEAAKIISEVFK
jgi:hypothetical protein